MTKIRARTQGPGRRKAVWAFVLSATAAVGVLFQMSPLVKSSVKSSLHQGISAIGGVVVFLHIPKSGGTTIRKAVQDNKRDFPKVRFAGIYVENQLGEVQRKVQEQLRAKTDTTLFVEIHDRSSSNLKQLAPLLRHWKQLAKDHRKPFVAFTVLRDPIDYAVSLFNFFHVLGGFFGVQQYARHNGTVQEFGQVMLEGNHLNNPQCLYLVKGELFDQIVTEEECHWALETLQETMDWVGDTKTLSTQTLPWLQNLLVSRKDEAKQIVLSESAYESKKLGQNNPSSNQLLQRSDIDSSILQLIRDRSAMDQLLFDQLVGKALLG